MSVSTPACRIQRSAREGSGRKAVFQFRPDPFGRKLRNTVLQPGAGAQAIGFRPARTVPGEKPEKPQDAQIILANALFGIADETQRPRFDIGKPAHIVDDGAVSRRIERIDGEIAPLRIGFPVSPEGDPGMAAVRLHILPQRRHLERMPLHDDGDRAMLHAGRHRLETGFPCQPHRFLGPVRGCEIDIAHLAAQKRVAHRAADDASLAAVAVQRLESACNGFASSQSALSEILMLSLNHRAFHKVRE